MKPIVVIILLTAITASAFWYWKHSGNADQQETQPTKSTAEARLDGYVTSDSCRKCHEQQYDSWHRTYHRTMTQKASSDSVVGNFDDVKLSAYGRDYHLQQKDGQYLVTMVPPEWETELLLSGSDPMAVPDPPIVTRPVVQTTGSHLMQTYWVDGGDGLRQVPWFFHIEEQMWIPAEDSFLTPPENNRVYSIWNMQCIKCHATGGQPRQNRFDGKFHSKVPELGIACEACHGSASEHVAIHSESGGKKQNQTTAVIFNPSKADHVQSSHACGQCHSSSVARDMESWLQTGSSYRPGEDFTQFAMFESPSSESQEVKSEYPDQGFWNDECCRVGGDEFLGLMNSACYLDGQASCLSCHSMHNSDPTDQLRSGMRTNDACLQCHKEYEQDVSSHTHHAPGSSGSLCYNCHMPHTSYALFKAIRSHQIDIPKVSGLANAGRPNACNLCHLNKTLAWSAKTLNKWYRIPQAELTEQESTTPAGILWLLKGDAMQRIIAAWHMGWQPARETIAEYLAPAPFLAATTNDPYAAIRFVAWRSLKKHEELADVKFEFSNDEQQNQQLRDDAFRQVQIAFPLLPSIRKTHLDATDYPHLLQEIEKIQSERDNRRIHIPE